MTDNLHDYAEYCVTLTADELVSRLEDWAITNVIGGRSQVYPEREILIAALRKSVIEEASVGSVSIKKSPMNGLPLIDDLTVLRGFKQTEWNTYSLIPEEKR